MAEEFNFDGIDLTDGAGTTPPPKGLSFEQRMIVQNYFDTQPKRRAAYLKKHGYEMNPRNDNQYRPIGSDVAYDDIDPGFFEAYLPNGETLNLLKSGSLKEIGNRMIKTAKEVGADIGDIAFDMASGTVTTAASAPFLAAGPLGLGAFFTAGAIANGGAEYLKKELGDVFLDENVPVDGELAFWQSVASGAMPILAQAAKAGGKTVMRSWLQTRKEAVINAAKKAGGGLNDKIINRAIKEPEMFSPQNVEGATKRLQDTYKNIFGLDDAVELGTPDSIRGGMFGDKIKPLNDAANAEVAKLAKNRAADFSFDDLAKPIKAQLAQYSNDPFTLDDSQKAARSYLMDRFEDLKKMASKSSEEPSNLVDQFGKKLTPENRGLGNVDFKSARKWLSSIQSDVLDRDVAGNFKNDYGKELSKAIGGTDGVLSILNTKAASVGSQLPSINQERSRILKSYNSAREALKPTNIERAFIGDDSVSKLNIQDAVKGIDEVLGSTLSQDIESGAMQRVVENMYKNPKGFGSGRVNSEMVAQGVEGAVKGGFGGGALGGALAGQPGMITGGLTGAAIGGLKGAKSAADLATPEKALEFIRSQASRISELDKQIGSSVPQAIVNQKMGVPAEAAARALGQGATSSSLPVETPSESFNFDDIDLTK